MLFLRAYGWAPATEPLFNATEQLHANHPGQRENQDADKDLVGLKGRAGNRDHKTYPGGGGIEFADHDADQCATDR